jgi:hypothetical protein
MAGEYATAHAFIVAVLSLGSGFGLFLEHPSLVCHLPYITLGIVFRAISGLLGPYFEHV